MANEFFIPDYIEINSNGRGNTFLNKYYTIKISGAKNEVLGVMAAAVLTDQPVILDNVPHISDVLDMGKIMLDLGIIVEYSPETRRMFLHAKEIKSNILSDEAFKFRASYYIWGALLARFAITKEFDSLIVPVSGGCSFAGGRTSSGKRATDFHTNLLRNIFNARVLEKDDRIIIKLPAKQPKIDKNPIFCTRLVSHGATFHWILSAATARRTKFLYNASMEPEVGHLLGILNSMGAKLRGTHHTAITCSGTGKLLKGGHFSILPDRLETASYVLLALALNSDITLDGIDTESCIPWLNSVKEISGLDRVQSLGVCHTGKYEKIKFDFRNLTIPSRIFQISPFPGKETDLHQVWAPVLACGKFKSIIIDPIWGSRFAHLPEMAKFGLNAEHNQIKIKNSTVTIALQINIYPSDFASANTTGMDLRGTFGLIMCACIAKGNSRIDNPSFALRGYPELIDNLKGLGLSVRTSETGKTLPTLPELKR